MALILSAKDTAGSSFSLDFATLKATSATGDKASFNVDSSSGNASFNIGPTAHSIPVTWQFSTVPATKNQLVVSAGGTSLSLPGQIRCPNPTALSYQILDAGTGAFTGAVIALNGSYKLNSDLDQLVFTTATT